IEQRPRAAPLIRLRDEAGAIAARRRDTGLRRFPRTRIGERTMRKPERSPFTPLLAAALMLAASATLARRADAAENVDLKKSVAKDAAIRVTNVTGSLKLSGWDKDELSVTGSIGTGVEKVDVSGEPDHVQVRVVLHKNSGDGGANLVIKVPVS